VAFLRFVTSKRHPDSGVEAGLFGAAYALRDDGDIGEIDRASLKDHLAWFGKNLSVPERFNRSTSKGSHRRTTKGIAWFRDTAKEHLARMHDMKRIIESNGYLVTVVREERVGYIVYEDAVQVVAEPFSETRTGG
jgi:hypothetical protein